MKARFCLGIVFLMGLMIACQSETQSLPEHAKEVREKHRVKDSLRSLEIIESLARDSSHIDSTLRPQN